MDLFVVLNSVVVYQCDQFCSKMICHLCAFIRKKKHNDHIEIESYFHEDRTLKLNCSYSWQNIYTGSGTHVYSA